MEGEWALGLGVSFGLAHGSERLCLTSGIWWQEGCSPWGQPFTSTQDTAAPGDTGQKPQDPNRWAYRVQVGALVLGAVTGVAEGLMAPWVLAQVWLLTRVAPQVDLEVFQS